MNIKIILLIFFLCSSVTLAEDIPCEQRGEEFRKYLSASLKIENNYNPGSGTIVYFDKATGEAYVASCGHLWVGNKTAEELVKNPVYCKVITWYHNDIKLEKTKSYDARVLFWSNSADHDCSLLKFKPDWTPNYFPIAPIKYDFSDKQYSLGCDNAEEVALYSVEITGYQGLDLTTKHNTPRPGRSGGGLLSEDGYLTAICWGHGNGFGYFTPLKSIYSIYSQNNYKWILNIQPVSNNSCTK